MISEKTKKTTEKDSDAVRALISEYNDVALGLRKSVRTAKASDEQVAALARHVFEYYLQWSPKDIESKLNYELLGKLQLKNIFNERFQFPHELNMKKDCFYYAHLLYPEQIGYDLQSQIIRTYQQVLSGERRTFPANFFGDDDALERAEICLREALRTKSFPNIASMYKFFASDEAIPFLTKMKLNKPLQAYYKNPLTFLHYALGTTQSSLWYNYYIFLSNM